MPQALVYGVFNKALVWNQQWYGDGSAHYVVQGAPVQGQIRPREWGYPLDIGDISGLSHVHCQVSSNIDRIVVRRFAGVCTDKPEHEVAKYGVVCELYAAGNQFVGAMLYGHLRRDSRAAPGTYDRSHPSFSHGGWVIGFPAPDCRCGKCATGVHVHAQAWRSAGYYNPAYIPFHTPIERKHPIWIFNY